jgi:hypothetical protein
MLRHSADGIASVVAAGGESARPREGAPGKTNDFFLDEPAGVGYCFSELTSKVAPCVSRGPRPGRVAILAKRNGGQALENKQFREMPDFAPAMISKTYGQAAKPLVSLGEMKPLAGFPPRREAKRKGRKIDHGFALPQPDAPKWRRKPLKWLKTDS